MEGKNIDFVIIDEACQKAANIISEAVSKFVEELKPTTDRLAELMELVNEANKEANKPPQGRDAFRGFIESRDKRKNYRKQIRR